MAKAIRLRVNVSAPFPTRAVGGDSINVSKANGVYTIKSNYPVLGQIALPPNPAQKLLKVYDAVTGIYNTMPLSALTAGASGGVSSSWRNILLNAAFTINQRGRKSCVSFALTSISNANPAVFTLNGHALTAGSPFQLTTTGTLPAGLSTGTTYYVLSNSGAAGTNTVLTANTFQASATFEGAPIATSSAGSGTHSVVPIVPPGAYAHDRWKGGAAGGDYTFTQLVSATQITILPNKSLIQIVENVNVVGGSYILSWSGTATARVAVNGSVPAGNFAVSPITIVGQNPGSTMAVEFTGANAAGGSSLATNSGTLGTVQLEQGAAATPFETKIASVELQMCLRYFEVFGTAIARASPAEVSGAALQFFLTWGVAKRTNVPGTKLIVWGIPSPSNVNYINAFNGTVTGFEVYFIISAALGFVSYQMAGDAEL